MKRTDYETSIQHIHYGSQDTIVREDGCFYSLIDVEIHEDVRRRGQRT